MRVLAGALLIGLLITPALGQDPALTEAAVNEADITQIPAESSATPSPAIIKLEVLLDRAGASPGVIDGFDGDNFRKAIAAFAQMHGGGDNVKLSPDLAAELPASEPILTQYTITAKDLADIGPPIPSDYAEMAKLAFLGYASVAEELAERFHMDEDLLKALNPGAEFAENETIVVAAPGSAVKAKVARLVADKGDRQLRGYDAEDKLVIAYPATIGSQDNPSPSGTHRVSGIAKMPNYTYDPSINFKQGNNTEKLVLPPGPNGPVGSMWIDLTEPTFGIHGTPEPSKIDKVASHGCVRLTNWDAEELGSLVAPGVPVEFTD